MKNVHLIPTDKPNRLYYNKNGRITFSLCKTEKENTPLKPCYNIYITSDKEIKEGDWVIALDANIVFKCNKYEAEKPIKQFKSIYKKIILTTDQDLIKDGVQAIDDEFLEWFVNNPSCEEVEVVSKDFFYDKEYWHTRYKIIIPKEEYTIVDKLKEYFKNTSEEQIQKDWDKTCEKTKGINSPTVEEFLEAQKQNLIDMMQEDEKLGLYDETEHLLSNKANKERLLEDVNKQETLEEVAPMVELVVFLDRIKKNLTNKTEVLTIQLIIDTIKSEFVDKELKWQQERMYSEEEVRKMLFYLGDVLFNNCQNGIKEGEPEEYFDVIIEQFKKK
jgi:hypothetical protein